MRIDWWTLGLQTINVLLLVWILARFLFRPIVTIVEARRAEAARLLADAETARAEAIAQNEKAAREATRLASTRNEVISAAAADAAAERTAILAAAREEADQLRATVAAEVARSREGAAEAVAGQASRLAVDIAAKLLARLPDAARIDGFTDGLAAAVAALPEASRSSIAAAGEPLRLRAARGLTAAEIEACRSALAHALGRAVAVVVETDRSLIAGLEIDTPHAVVRNSFRADLDRIAEELMRHDHAGR